jgi:hypothetical protein
MTTTRIAGVLITLGLALALAGAVRTPAAPYDPADGALAVREHQLPSDGIYIEGYVAFLRVRSLDVPSGDVAISRRFDVADPRVHLQTRLMPGTYRLIRFVRPCDGNCGYLDPKTERCAATLGITAGDAARATVRTRVGHRCKIRIS